MNYLYLKTFFTRYYFNGDLTENKDLALFFPYTPNARLEAAVNNGEQVQPNHTDIWKEDVCAKLNKIILLLRNAYIDTLGETWEQPEDFGKLRDEVFLSHRDAGRLDEVDSLDNHGVIPSMPAS